MLKFLFLLMNSYLPIHIGLFQRTFEDGDHIYLQSSFFNRLPFTFQSPIARFEQHLDNQNPLPRHRVQGLSTRRQNS